MSSDNGAAGSGELTGLSDDADMRAEGVAAAEAALAVDPEVEAAASADDAADVDDADDDAPVETLADDDAADEDADDDTDDTEAEAVEVDPVTEMRDALRRAPGEWYVVHSYAGYENKVKTNLETRIQTLDMEDYIFQVEVPTEEVTEIKNGQRKQVQRKVLPGYILVRMELNDPSWSAVRNTPGVTGFVGASNEPVPLTQTEVDRLMHRESPVRAPSRAQFSIGESVKVISGPLSDFSGEISEINEDASKLKVLVSIFGRETPVEVGFDQVKKI